MAIQLSTAARDALGAALIAEIGASGLIKLYTGTPPATCGSALSGNTLLGTLTASATFGTMSSGVLTANTITEDSSADATGTATFFRVFKSDGTTCCGQGTVGTSSADINLNSTSVAAGGSIRCSSFVWTMPGA